MLYVENLNNSIYIAPNCFFMKLLYLLLIFSVCFTASFAQSSNGLVAHWNFNGNAKDISGNGHDGNIHGARSVAGYSGKPNTALSFNGSGDYIAVPYDSTLGLDSFSICVFLKVNHTNSNSCQTEAIISKGVPGAIGSYGISFSDNSFDHDCTVYTPGNNNYYVVTPAASDTDRLVVDGAPVDTDRYMCLTGTYDGTNATFYVDGALVSSYSLPQSSAFVNVPEALFIGYAGANPKGSENYFNGIIDDIRLYNRVLSAEEVKQFCYGTANSNDDGASDDPGNSHSIVSPNPNNGTFSVKKTTANTNTLATLTVTSMFGQVVYQADVPVLNGVLDTYISLQAPPGVYYLMVNCGNDNSVTKFIIK